MENVIVLEQSTNTHVLHGEAEAKTFEDVTLLTLAEEKAYVVHGEHNTLGVEGKFVAKVVQQELNPISKAYQKAFD